jgi:hypothetical protein
VDSGEPREGKASGELKVNKEASGGLRVSKEGSGERKGKEQANGEPRVSKEGSGELKVSKEVSGELRVAKGDLGVKAPKAGRASGVSPKDSDIYINESIDNSAVYPKTMVKFNQLNITNIEQHK